MLALSSAEEQPFTLGNHGQHHPLAALHFTVHPEDPRRWTDRNVTGLMGQNRASQTVTESSGTLQACEKICSHGERSICRRRCCGPAPGLDALRPPDLDMAKKKSLRRHEAFKKDMEAKRRLTLSSHGSNISCRLTSEVKPEVLFLDQKHHVSPERHRRTGDLIT